MRDGRIWRRVSVREREVRLSDKEGSVRSVRSLKETVKDKDTYSQ